MNPGILVTVKKDVVEFQVHHSPQHLEGSGAVKVSGVISNGGPVNTSRKSPIFQVQHLFLQVPRLTIFISLLFFQGYLSGLIQNHQ